MKISLLALGLVGAALLPAFAQQPSANQVLHQMSDTLAAARTFSFSATREVDAGLLGDARAFVGRTKIDALVQRTDKLAIHSVNRLRGAKQFVFDGRTLTVYDAKTNYYSVAPVEGSLDVLADTLDERYDFTPPLIEFTVSDPYRNLRRDADAVLYLGREKLSACCFDFIGVECDRVMLKGDLADAELWIGVKDHLPRKLVATFKLLPEKPQLRIAFSRWNLAAKASPADFVFTPPKGATKIEMWTVSKMQKATSKR